MWRGVSQKNRSGHEYERNISYECMKFSRINLKHHRKSKIELPYTPAILLLEKFPQILNQHNIRLFAHNVYVALLTGTNL